MSVAFFAFAVSFLGRKTKLTTTGALLLKSYEVLCGTPPPKVDPFWEEGGGGWGGLGVCYREWVSLIQEGFFCDGAVFFSTFLFFFCDCARKGWLGSSTPVVHLLLPCSVTCLMTIPA